MTTIVDDRLGHRAVRVLRTAGDLTPVEPEWRRLAEELGNAFVTPEWFRCWLAQYGEDCSPYVAVATGTGGVSALLPLVETRGRFGPMFRFGGYNLGDCFEPLGTAVDRADAIDLLGDAVTSRGTVLVLDNVEGDWPSTFARRTSTTTANDAALPVIRFAGHTGDEFVATLSRNLRSQLRRKRAALEREHFVEFRLSTPERLEEDLRQLFRLHDARWEERGGSSIASPRARLVLCDFAARAMALGWLRLWTLEADGRPIAAWYGWRLGARYGYYTAGFDPAYGGYSPGLLLLTHTICAAADEGAEAYDFLQGDEAYKARFATGVRRTRTVVIAPRLHPVRLTAEAGRYARTLALRLPHPVREAVRPLAGVLPTSRTR